MKISQKINIVPVITIDGPSGCGKGSLAKAIAAKLAWHILDSGILYRVVAWHALKKNVDLQNESDIVSLTSKLPIKAYQDPPKKNELRTENCAAAASKVATLPKVREILLQKQRDFRRLPGLVADGRDMGTVVFPDAMAKIYLIASPECRAQRRKLQLEQSHTNAPSLKSILDAIMERDARDKGRAAAPLLPAEDAIVIDTTELDMAQVFVDAMAKIKHIMC